MKVTKCMLQRNRQTMSALRFSAVLCISVTWVANRVGIWSVGISTSLHCFRLCYQISLELYRCIPLFIAFLYIIFHSAWTQCLPKDYIIKLVELKYICFCYGDMFGKSEDMSQSRKMYSQWTITHAWHLQVFKHWRKFSKVCLCFSTFFFVVNTFWKKFAKVYSQEVNFWNRHALKNSQKKFYFRKKSDTEAGKEW